MFSIASLLLSGFLTFVELNCENLFDCQHDSLKNDTEFLPTAGRQWTPRRYWRKLDNIGRTIISSTPDTVSFQLPDLVALVEVENDSVLHDLTRRSLLRHAGYEYVMTCSPDERGLDVALLYQPFSFQMLQHRALRIEPLAGMRPTRDILYAAGVLPCGDTLHLYECHLPSMSGGQQVSEWKRQAAKAVIRRHVDSLLLVRPKALVAVMGDMNGRPTDDITGLTNRMIPLEKKGCGSHRYRGIWTCLDQIYLSSALDTISDVQIFTHPVLLEEDRQYLDSKPRRTFQRFRYDKNGFSDHLPVYFDFCLP